MNHRFSVWLMSKADVESQALVLDGKRTIQFSKEDIGLVFGIPCSGRRVVDRRNARKEKKNTFSRNIPGSDAKDQRSIKAAQEVLDREYGLVMSKEEQRSFKTAFVVYVMSCLLVPFAKHDYATTEYWNALVDPDEIQMFDWSAYVFQRLMDVVLKLKTDIMKKIRVSNLTGCSLFLQVFYLDSMDLGIWNNRHGLLPRV